MQNPFAPPDIRSRHHNMAVKRPGRSNAGSNTSGRLVAAMRMTPSLDSKPSISTSNWFSVCSRSSLPAAEASAAVPSDGVNSSIKIMQGACFLP